MTFITRQRTGLLAMTIGVLLVVVLATPTAIKAAGGKPVIVSFSLSAKNKVATLEAVIRPEGSETKWELVKEWQEGGRRGKGGPPNRDVVGSGEIPAGDESETVGPAHVSSVHKRGEIYFVTATNTSGRAAYDCRAPKRQCGGF